MEISVEFYGMWRDIVGASCLVLRLRSGATIADLLAELGATSGQDVQRLLVNPETGELWSAFAIAVNETLIERAAEIGRVLVPNDRVTLFHPIVGG